VKRFLIWTGLVVLLFALLGAGSHLARSASREKVLVAIDVSVSLEEYKHRLPAALAFLSHNPYAEFKVVTNSPNRELAVLQDWSPGLDLTAVRQIKMYTVFPLEKLLEFDEIRTADRIVFVTNQQDTEALEAVPRSRIVQVR